MADFRLLVPVEAWLPDRPLDLGSTKQRAVLAALLADVGRPVAVDTLIDRVWDQAPPAQVRNVLYSHLSRIRRLVGTINHATAGSSGIEPIALERRGAGYLLRLDPDRVDLHRF